MEPQRLKLVDSWDEFGQKYSYFVDEYGDKVDSDLANQIISDRLNRSSKSDRRLLLIKTLR